MGGRAWDGRSLNCGRDAGRSRARPARSLRLRPLGAPAPAKRGAGHPRPPQPPAPSSPPSPSSSAATHSLTFPTSVAARCSTSARRCSRSSLTTPCRSCSVRARPSTLVRKLLLSSAYCEAVRSCRALNSSSKWAFWGGRAQGRGGGQLETTGKRLGVVVHSAPKQAPAHWRTPPGRSRSRAPPQPPPRSPTCTHLPPPGRRPPPAASAPLAPPASGGPPPRAALSPPPGSSPASPWSRPGPGTGTPPPAAVAARRRGVGLRRGRGAAPRGTCCVRAERSRASARGRRAPAAAAAVSDCLVWAPAAHAPSCMVGRLLAEGRPAPLPAPLSTPTPASPARGRCRKRRSAPPHAQASRLGLRQSGRMRTGQGGVAPGRARGRRKNSPAAATLLPTPPQPGAHGCLAGHAAALLVQQEAPRRWARQRQQQRQRPRRTCRLEKRARRRARRPERRAAVHSGVGRLQLSRKQHAGCG